MLTGKRVLITGAGSGIGAITAQMLAERGAVPILTGRNEAKLKEAASLIKGSHGVYVLDVNDNREVKRVTEQIIADYKGLDVLLNNAGYAVFDYFEEAKVEDFEEMMNTNYLGIVRCTKAVLPVFLQQGHGQIVNVASMAGKIGTAKSTAYTATKHAVLGFTNALRAEMKDRGITVSAVNPGPIDTPFFTKADPEGTYVRNVKAFMMKPERVAAAILKVIDKGIAEVDIPLSAAAGIKLYQLFPRLADRLVGPMLNKK
ncbi:SDR family NAD(P)-dependent oxidoreductase [Paenibacillus tarimensis]|uniref:SDR family NAD(P)-dependent oxidoreductase n=1 Tax=Paenibacillus tarimensis TaxID=416012 RepID=UPI001F45BE1F|nr:SDR family oxidoreductase [Paenibacillus tarimensis]MCF2942953.1 SDR family oxidoreductase [Paenibacillus tarimensis]